MKYFPESGIDRDERKERAARLKRGLAQRKNWSPEQIAIEEAALKREVAARLSEMSETKSETEDENTDV